jgi:hypothetical protein
MDNIIEPNERFDFSKLTLSHPSGVQGGAYFTKIEYNKKPLYIQTSKSLTRQGFVKTGKKYYCDLMFDKNSEVLINWFENLEEKCQKLIYEKRESWFQNSLEESDIESAFNSLIRVYKSGKYYLLRTNVKSNRLDEPAVKIYNENEVSLSMNDVTHETNLISILEIQGIKFTSRNFQIEIELKQVMVLDNEPIFESCLIKSSKNIVSDTETLEKPQITKEVTLENIEIKENTIVPKIVNNENDVMKNIEIDNIDNIDTIDNIDNIDNIDTKNTNETNEKKDENILELDVEDLNKETYDEPKEVDIHLDNNEETIQLKKPNQVYFELYKKAREKAKEAKKNAIIAFLEAKNIKKTYMIENVNDSDSEFDEFDAEIDEISESELEDF